jgi:hypothetical protein
MITLSGFQCSPKWFRFGSNTIFFFRGLCYFTSNTKLSWSAAATDCSNREGRLANPKTWDEWRQLIPDQRQAYWTGQSRCGKKNIVEW